MNPEHEPSQEQESGLEAFEEYRARIFKTKDMSRRDFATFLGNKFGARLNREELERRS